MENSINTAGQQPQPQHAKPIEDKPAKKPMEEFSFGWHMMVLAYIYVALGLLYLALKFFLK